MRSGEVGSVVLGKMKCATCGILGAGDNIESHNNKRIEKQLKEWHKDDEKIVKLLLLGAGESGKSTVTKQMKIIHINGYNDIEKKEKVPYIRRNLRDSILTILGAMSLLNIPLEDESNQECVDFLMKDADSEEYDYPQLFYDYTERLWNDRGVQTCFHRSSEYQLIDSAKYFMERISAIRNINYTPTEQDILRCRVMTNSIQRIDFTQKDKNQSVQFSVFDVGGQRGERRKWIQVFDSATAILFVLDCSSFDLTLREDQTRNRLLEAAEIFEQVWNSRWLRYVSIILFINKIDLLEEKINSGKSFDKFVDSIHPDNPYYDLFNSYKTFQKPKDSERHEFMESFPGPDSDNDAGKSRKGSRKGSRVPSLFQNINEEVIKTAVFIKRVFMQLVSEPRQSSHGAMWHDSHSCEYFYTCAIDTQTIKKVLDGCRSLIIKKHLERMGINIY